MGNVVSLMGRRDDGGAEAMRRLRTAEDREPWVTKKAAAAHVSYSTRTVDRWIEKDGLPQGVVWKQMGGQRRFLLSALESWLEERGDVAAA